MKTKKTNLKLHDEARVYATMSRGVRGYLANFFPEASMDIAVTVLIRIAVDCSVRMVGRERAPVILSHLINLFLSKDHDD